MKRILLIDVNCKSSSTGQIVYDSYSYLNSHGFEAAICYGRGPVLREKNIYKFGVDIETLFHAFLTRVTGFTGCFSFFSTIRLLRFIRKFKPDIVHIHELHAYFVNIRGLLSFLSKRQIPVVHTLHSEFSFTGKCGHSIECEKWKTKCGPCPHLHSYPCSILFDHTRFMQNEKKQAFLRIPYLSLITPSVWLASRAKESFLKNTRIQVIHNGINTNVFRPYNCDDLRKELLIPKEDKIVLAVAPNLMSKEKGGYEVLEIAKDLSSQKIRFILIGTYGVEIEDLPRNVIVIDRVTDKNKLAQFYSLADIFLICSERENYPTTCIEAQACGTPICGYSTGGTTETSVYSGNFFAPYGDRKQLESFIISFPKKTLGIEEALRKKALDEFDNDNVFNRVVNYYKQTQQKSDCYL